MKFDGRLFLVTVQTFVTACSGLQCPRCTYITHTGDIQDLVKTFVDTILHAFQSPECAQSLPAAIPEILEETCAVTSGKVSRCSFYAGNITLKINAYLTEFDVPLRIYQRSCMQFTPASVPSVGCHFRNDVTEDKTFLKQLLDQASSALASLDLVKFNGTLCLCSDTYCETSGATGVNTSVTYSYLIVFIFVQLVIR